MTFKRAKHFQVYYEMWDKVHYCTVIKVLETFRYRFQAENYIEALNDLYEAVFIREIYLKESTYERDC